MSDRENLGAGIYAALSALVAILCLAGAFWLPSFITFSKWLGLMALVGYFFLIPILLRVAERSRIREAVRELGGTIILMKRIRFWDQPSRNRFFLGVKYRVEYVDLLGATHRALCKSGYFQGVVWLEDLIVDGATEAIWGGA